ncbi:MAG: sugar phosphate isomerase/epimerase family protein [bacterium]
MRYAFMSFSAPEASLDQLLTMARDYGYDGIEPRAGAGTPHAHGIEIETNSAQRAAICERIERSGIQLCCIATSCRYAHPDEVAVSIEQTAQYIDLAGDLGCPRLRVFGGAFEESDSREDAIARVASALRAVAEHAERRGVTLCLETHDAWTDPTHVAEVMRRADHSAVRVNWDVMHPQRAAGWSMDAAYHELKPWIHHVHVHDGVDDMEKLELKSIGEGDFDHRRVIVLLAADGYDGFISGEWIGWTPATEHLPREVETLRSYEQDALEHAS